MSPHLNVKFILLPLATEETH